MVTCKGENIFLRALEVEDLNFLYEMENDEAIWQVSETITPYSRLILKNYLKNSKKDIFETKQLRLGISTYQNSLVGLIDVYNFNPLHKRAGIGILIKETCRKKGFAEEALTLLINYLFTHLQLHQIYATILEDNQASIALFTKLNFTLSGIKKDWVLVQNKYKNQHIYQLINYVHS